MPLKAEREHILRYVVMSHDDGLFVEQLDSAKARRPGVEQCLREFVEGQAAPLVACMEAEPGS